MITCRRLAEFLDDYVADRLPPLLRARFELHLKMCRPCREYLDSYRRTVAIVHETGASDLSGFDEPEQLPAMPDAMVATIMHAMREAG